MVDVPYVVVGSADDRVPWLEARRTGIGASEIAGVCGESRWMSPYSVWARKTGRLPEQDETEPMLWGKLLEPVVLAEYARRTGRGAERHGKLIRSKAHPWAIASLDGFTWTDPSVRWPLEIKTASAYVTDEWEEGPPPAYYLQIQHQLLVTGAPKATSACLLGGQRFVWCDVERDAIAINRIIAKGSEMWSRIERDEPPPVDGHVATLEALSYVFPRDNGETVLLPFDMLEVAHEYDAAKQRAKEIEKQIDDLRARIESALGHHTRGVLPDGTGWTWTHQTRSAYTVPASECRVMRRVKPKKNREAA